MGIAQETIKSYKEELTTAVYEASRKAAIKVLDTKLKGTDNELIDCIDHIADTSAKLILLLNRTEENKNVTTNAKHENDSLDVIVRMLISNTVENLTCALDWDMDEAVELYEDRLKTIMYTVNKVTGSEYSFSLVDDEIKLYKDNAEFYLYD